MLFTKHNLTYRDFAIAFPTYRLLVPSDKPQTWLVSSSDKSPSLESTTNVAILVKLLKPVANIIACTSEPLG